MASWIKQSQALNEHGHADGALRREAKNALGMLGLRVIDVPDPEERGTFVPTLYVLNSHPALQRLFTDTPWPGPAGAQGGWVNVLRRLPGSSVPTSPPKVGNATGRGTLVPVAHLIDWDDE